MRCLFQVVLLMSATTALQAQFTITPVNLPQVYASSVAWGDYDNDGYLDIAIIGTTTAVADSLDLKKNVARIFHNNGDGTFTEDTAAHLMPVCIGTIAWGDYDNDGNLDLLYGGVDTLNNQVTKLYHNDGNGKFTTFTENTSSTFHSSSYGCVTWGDYNNDGFLDILVSGVDLGSALAVAKLYQNNKNGTFTEVTSAVLQGVNGLSKVSFGDYDNDGFKDILLNGRTTRDWSNPQSMTKLYHNNGGTGSFTEDTAAHFVGVAHGPTAFGDFNNDGFLDVLDMGIVGPAVGGSGFVQVDTTIIYLNINGTGRFTPTVVPALAKPFQANVTIGDYDADGNLDLLMNGYLSAPELFKGNGAGSFTSQTLGSPELAFGGIAWGDFNNDGYLDALVSGIQSSNGADYAALLRNSGSGTSSSNHANAAPSPPTGLASVVSGDTVTFTWNRGTDGQTPQAGLSYSVRVGTTPGGSDVVSIPAASNGKRRLSASGAQGENIKWILRGLASGTYYWSIQSVDDGYLGSTFATEQTFTVGAIAAKVKFMLQGPFSTISNTMLNTLASGGTLAGHFHSVIIPSRAVDSVAIEIRDSLTAAKSHHQAFTPCWLLTDGTICSFADTTQPFVTFNEPAGAYYVALHHRNHLAVMSAAPIALTGDAPRRASGSRRGDHGDTRIGSAVGGWIEPLAALGLAAGDVNQSGIITAADANALFSFLNLSSYLNGDVNLSGIVTAADANILYGNLNMSSNVP